MTINELKAAFQRGRLSKAAYIDAMARRHEVLHDYAELIGGSEIAKIEIDESSVVMTMRGTGVKLACPRGDKRAAPFEILNFGALEKEAAMIFRLVQDDDTVFDIGANIGWYALTLERLFKRLKILAFEPIAPTYHRLKDNIALNRSRVKAHPFGFWEAPGVKTFYFPATNTVNASAADLSGEGRKVACRVRRLDDFAARSRVDFIKCDVEGGELFVFKGGLKVLRRERPIIFAEMLRKWAKPFGYHPNAIIDLLGGIGYRPFVARGKRLLPFGRMNDKTVETNFFFLDPLKHAACLRRVQKT